MSIPTECRAADTSALFAFLEQHVETSLFLLENLRTQGITEAGPAYVVSREGDSIVGAASVNAGGVLLLQAPRDPAPLAAFAITRREIPLRGILGPTTQVAAVLDELRLRDAPARMHSEERFYRLDLRMRLNTIADPDSHVRIAGSNDIDALTAYRRAYLIEALGATDDAALNAPARAEAERMCHDGTTFVLVAQEEILAMTAFTARHERVVQIGGVFTPEHRRRRHFGRIVVAGSLDYAAREWGAERAVLFTEEGNSAAQRAYESLGFTRNGGYTLHFFRAPIAPSAFAP